MDTILLLIAVNFLVVPFLQEAEAQGCQLRHFPGLLRILRLSHVRRSNWLRSFCIFALFLLALPVYTFVLSPLAARYSRRHEFEADAFAVRNASAQALVSALVKLYEDNASTLTPDPVHSAFYDSHPPAAVRVARLVDAGAAEPA